MKFEQKFDLKDQLSKTKNKNEIYDLSFNTFCVNFVNQMINNGFTLDKKLDVSSAYFALELPTKSVIKTKLKHQDAQTLKDGDE